MGFIQIGRHWWKASPVSQIRRRSCSQLSNQHTARMSREHFVFYKPSSKLSKGRQEVFSWRNEIQHEMLHPCAQHGCWGRKGAAYGTGSCLWPRNWASIPSKAWTLCSRVDSEPQENLEQRRALKAPSRSDGTCVVKIWGRGTRYCMSYFVSAIAMSVSLCVRHQPHSRFFLPRWMIRRHEDACKIAKIQVEAVLQGDGWIILWRCRCCQRRWSSRVPMMLSLHL